MLVQVKTPAPPAASATRPYPGKISEKLGALVLR